MKGYEIGFLKKVFKLVVEDDAEGFGLAFFDIRVIGDEFHAETLCSDRDIASYPSKTHNTERLVVKFDAHEALPVPFAFFERIVGERDLPGCGEHNSHGKFRSGKCIACRSVEHDNAFFACRFYIDVIHAYAGPSYDFQLSGVFNEGVGDGCPAPCNNGVILTYDFFQFIVFDTGFYVYLNVFVVAEDCQSFL